MQSPHAILPPATLLQDRYLVLGLIGRGGMGAVYEARDQRFDSPVALKQTFFSDAALRRAFEREARLLNRLRHPALPMVMDHFSEGGGQFLVMQFIPGEDLAAMLERQGGPFPPGRVLRWADQLLDALDYLHTHEPPIIHRDIKPQNLKLTARGDIVLLDFGLAKGEPGQVTGDGASLFAFTPNYAPIEQIQQQGTDARSDLYALGAALYHLMTGVKPPDALVRLAAVADAEADPLRPADKINPQVSPALATALHQAMALRREKRFATAAAMRRALRGVDQPTTLVGGGADTSVPPAHANPGARTGVASSPAAPAAQTEARYIDPHSPTAPATVPEPTTTEVLPRPSARGPWLWLVLGGVAILLGLVTAAGIGGWFNPGRRSPEPAGAAPESPAARGPAGLPLAAFEFDVPLLDSNGAVKDRRKGQARYFAEDLGGGVALEMVQIPAGAFTMGSPGTEERRDEDEGPQRRVSLPAFYMGKYEVTQAQWQAAAGWPKVGRDLNLNPSYFKGDDRPVDLVSWEDAVEFCERLSRRTGRKYRLPSEAEWEYACRAGTTTPFHFGETITTEFVSHDGSRPYGSPPKGPTPTRTAPVGSSRVANAFGLYDMHGNVWEWCLDTWQENYVGAPVDGSPRADGDTRFRVLRGAAWKDHAALCRSAHRNRLYPYDISNHIGFRVVMTDVPR